MIQRSTYTPLEPVDTLFRCLILADAVQAFADILIVYWAFKGRVVEGDYCTVQGKPDFFGYEKYPVSTNTLSSS